jgi:hypothetical protein
MAASREPDTPALGSSLAGATMIELNHGNGMAIENGYAVLMARIVDCHGRTIQRKDVAAIAYWIYERASQRPGRLQAVDGHDGVELDVAIVLSDALQTCRLWSVDAVGYNFRHEIDVLQADVLTEPGKHFDICYEFAPQLGEKVIIRFQAGSLVR